MRDHPHSPEAERAILGGVLEAPEQMVHLRHLQPDQFYRPDHGELWKLLSAMSAADDTIDLLTLPKIIRDTGRESRYGGLEYVVGLPDHCPAVANLTHYADQIQATYAARLRVEAGGILVRHPEDPDRVAAALVKLADAQTVETRRGAAAARSGLVMAATVGELAAAARLQLEGGALGVPFGIEPLDLAVSMRPGHLVILAARPAMGKTALMLSPLRGALGVYSGEQPRGVGIFSLEMGKEALGLRLIAEHANINYDLLYNRPGSLRQAEWDAIVKTKDVFGRLPWWVDDSPSLTVDEIIARTEYEHAQSPLAMIVVDYLTLMEFRGHASANRTERVGEASTKLKALAKRLGIVVLLLSQLNRKCEERRDKRPVLSDLRESGQIEQDADTVLFIYRDVVYNSMAPLEDAEVIVAKQRHGKTRIVPLGFKGQYQRFSERGE